MHPTMIIDHLYTIRWLIRTKVGVKEKKPFIHPVRSAHAYSEDELLYMIHDCLSVAPRSLDTERKPSTGSIPLTGYETNRLVDSCRAITKLVQDSEDLKRKDLPDWFRCINITYPCNTILEYLYDCFSTEKDPTQYTTMIGTIKNLIQISVYSIIAIQVASTVYLSNHLFLF